MGADDRHPGIMASLDAQAASALPDVLGGSGNLALTGVHAKHMAEKIIAGMARDSMSIEALASRLPPKQP